MCARWVSTVRTLRNSCSPISAFVWPRAIIRRTSCSRSERSSGARGSGGGPGGGGAARLRLGGRSGDARAERGVEVRLPRRDRAHDVHELALGGLLEHVGVG